MSRRQSDLEIVCDRLRITATVVTGNHADTSQDADDWRRNARAGEMTFEDYCSDFGISTDSRQAHATWVECIAMARRLRVFLGEHFDEVANAEH